MRPVRAVSALAARPRTRVRRIAVITVIVIGAAFLVIALLGFLAMSLMYVVCSHDPSCTPL